MDRKTLLAKEKIGKLLYKMSYPAIISMVVMAFYNLVDAIFIGKGVGILGIAAVAITFPLQMILFAVGQTVGMGSSSIISRALGEKNDNKANVTLGNAYLVAIVFGILATVIGLVFARPLLVLFGATPEILPFAYDYIAVMFAGSVLVTVSTAGAHIIRSEGASFTVMISMVLSIFINLGLDYLFIFVWGWGMKGAAFATILAHLFTFVYQLIFFASRHSLLTLSYKYLKPVKKILKEILTMGSSALVRHSSASLVMIVINNSLKFYGGNMAIAVYGIVGRLVGFAIMPIFGVVQGYHPIAGFNYGAKNYKRVKKATHLTIKVSVLMSIVGTVLILIFAKPLIGLFTHDVELVAKTYYALVILTVTLVFAGYQAVAPGYYRATGKALPAVIFAGLRQIILLIPLVLILPRFFGLNGVWYAFPIADILAAVIVYFVLKKELKSFGE